MERRDVVDAEFQVVEGPGRIRWGSVLWHSAVTMGLACYAVAMPVNGIEAALLVIGAALQWPLGRLFSGLSAPLLGSEQVQPLAARLRRGTRTKL